VDRLRIEIRSKSEREEETYQACGQTHNGGGSGDGVQPLTPGVANETVQWSESHPADACGDQILSLMVRPACEH
jgi:hypothetical protein